jgi:hypothetical protein
MAEPTQFLTATIDEYLLSIAEGITHAQEQLNMLPTLGPQGQPLPRYLLPRVDFELRVSLQVTQSQALTRKFATTGVRTAAVNHLVFRPIQPGETTVSGFKGEVISTIKGHFIAVPPNEGKPPLLLSTTVEKRGPGLYGISARVITAVGEPVAGFETHFNLDPALSLTLSKQDLPAYGGLSSSTLLVDGMVVTDASGDAATTLQTPAEPTGASIAVIVDVAGKTQTLIVKVE